MSFGVWFKQWVASFVKLLTVNTKKYKSEAQRKKERERRLKAKYSRANRYHTKKNRRRRRSSYSVQNERMIGAVFNFIAKTLSILLLPFGLLDWGRKSAKARKANRAKSASRKTSQKPQSYRTEKAPTNTTNNNTVAQHTRSAVNAPIAYAETEPTDSIGITPINFPTDSETKPTPAPEAVATTEYDELTPKSTPKNEHDRYIPKRMIIAGSYYCDKAVLDTLAVGSIIDLVAEPYNPYDKDAVKLLYNGRKIGYVAKKDRLAFITCLKLNRKIYGVITDIIEEDGKTKYEYETWFDSEKTYFK